MNSNKTLAEILCHHCSAKDDLVAKKSATVDGALSKSKLMVDLTMKNIAKLFVVLLGVTSFTTMGCGGGKYPAVSGKVTADGKPVANVRVVFTPTASGNNHTPGPWSKGVSDENGIYSLKTRYGESGAVAGPHKVGFEWNDIDFDSLSGLKRQLAEAKGDDARTADIKEMIGELKQKIKSRPKIDFLKVVAINIPKEGTDSANFEIGKPSNTETQPESP